jgi:RNA polymerase sigma-70 factor, ECF subfamily
VGMDERRAVERLKRGDIGGLEALVRAHQTRAVRTAYLICRDRALAEDVVQGAFLRAYEKIGRFDESRPFRPWFIKVVVNDAIKAASRRERTVQFQEGKEDPVALLADTEAGPEEVAEEAEERRRVWAALKKLPPAQRAAVVQRYYLGMSEAEMSEGGAPPPGTIKWRLHAARKSLSKLLRPRVHAEAPIAVSPEITEGGNDRD